jgi:hypothetical protein
MDSQELYIMKLEVEDGTYRFLNYLLGIHNLIFRQQCIALVASR